jgi:transposase
MHYELTDCVWFAIKPLLPNQPRGVALQSYLYLARNLIERFFNRINQCRRLAAHYDKLAANCLAFVQLASISLWLRTN